MYGYSNMSLGHRVMVTAAIVIVVMLILAFIGYISGRWEDAQAEVVAAPSKYDDRIGELEKEAIEAAFKQQIGQLYKIWVTDNYQPKLPPKAIVGARNARDAFIRSMDSIEERGQLAPQTK